MRIFPALAVAVLLGTSASAPKAQQVGESSYTGISVEASPQIFSTMCALDAAGFGADESTLAQMPGRLALRGDLLKMQGPATDALRQFYRDHALAGPGETLSRYITFALVVGPPPQFQFEGNPDLLPPDVLTLDGFQEILANFYREAHLDLRWARIEPEYEPTVERYRDVVRRIVTLANAYLREIVKPSTGRTFTVYVEPLVGARTNFRNYGDQYAIVVGTVSRDAGGRDSARLFALPARPGRVALPSGGGQKTVSCSPLRLVPRVCRRNITMISFPSWTSV